MNCPVCNVELKVADRQGIEIDYCPQCRGVWLDRGELDKIIERSATLSFEEDRDYDKEYRDEDRRYQRRRKRKSFLEEMFDVFD
jgi:Zn-finger nucleic acid-binding protein